MIKNFAEIQTRILISAAILFLFFFANLDFSDAAKVDELKSKIDERNSDIQSLEKEIAEYQKQLEKVGEEKKTLNSEIYRLNLENKKISTNINLTDKKIKSAVASLGKLKIDIGDKEEKIFKNTVALGETMRLIGEDDNNSVLEILLSANNLSQFFDSTEALSRFQFGVRERTKELKELKVVLVENKKEIEKKEKELVSYRSDLADQKEIVDYSKKEKDQLLGVTKNKESNYKKELAKKQKLMEEFEKEIRDLESQLKIEIDPNSIPDTGYGVLDWPLDAVFITQYFGKTEFSTKNPQVYKGNGHPGIDFRASVGTKVKAVLGGVVEGTGNTDTIPPKCYSYGKWVLIRHNNGLTTLYAHLSLIKVSDGQSVSAGEIVGYSGNTGYSTGPHLHFTVFASEGVKIQQFTNSINCKNKFVPVASYNAYLNPLSYLPKY